METTREESADWLPRHHFTRDIGFCCAQEITTGIHLQNAYTRSFYYYFYYFERKLVAIRLLLYLYSRDVRMTVAETT